MTMPLTQVPPNLVAVPERRRILKRQASLLNERQSWLAHWQDLNDYVLPRRLRYLQKDRNSGTKRNDKIINNKATKAARTLGAGKMAGQTSPARPWYRYQNPVIGDAEAAQWLADVEKETYATFGRSNFYSKIHETWFQQGVFSTAVIYVEEDEEDDIRCYVFPLGQYVLASSGKGRVDTCIREFSMSVEAVVREFGKDQCTPLVQQKWRDGLVDEWVDIVHAIEPNLNRKTGAADNKNMPFRSVWLEKNAPDDWGTFLRESGYEEQPFFVARWDAIGEDIYGSGSPGMDALGDSKAIQKLERQKAEAVDKVVRPPMKAPVSAKTQRLSMLPGDVSYVDETAQGAKYEPAIKVSPDSITAVEGSIREHEHRIEETYYMNLFLMMAMDSAQQPRTARDIAERSEEKMLMLGPVVDRDQDEVLDPLHNRVARILARRHKLPPVPASLQGQRIKVQYISIMAAAQKLVATAAAERYVSFVGSLSAVKKDQLDIPNFDKINKNYAESLGMKPDEINSEDVVKSIRDGRAQQDAQAQALAAAQQTAETAKVASQADTSGDNVLTRLMQGTGIQSPTPYGRA